MNRKKIKVAVDGPAGSGKSTIAKIAAEKLGLLYIDSGAMYRAVTSRCVRNGIDFSKKNDIINVALNSDIQFKKNNGVVETFLNGENISEHIRTREVTNNVSHVAARPEVREILVRQQQKFGENNSVIMDGRDIGTVVFPDAEIKIYLDASVEERTERRYKELSDKGQQVDFDKLKQEIIDRDNSDKNRKVGPLKIADDAVIVDTTGLTIEQVAEKVISIIRCKNED